MAAKLPKKDVVIIGLGWTGSIMASELAATGLDVVAIERGPWRDTANDFNIGYVQDELRYVRRHALMLQPKQETFTFRNNRSQVALPMREFGAFAPGTGLGGAGVHWSGLTWRFQPTDFQLKSHLTSRYGQKAVDESGLALRDWGITYDDLEPFYTKFERIAGIAGRGGNLRGVPQAGGNPFEGYRSEDYPLPPNKLTLAPTMFRDAASSLGYKPFYLAGGNASAAYTNPLGVHMLPCTWCGFCSHCGCANYSKSTPQTTILPWLMQRNNFEARVECEVTQILLDRSGKHATGITYVDSSDKEWEQPADLVICSAFQIHNVRMMLLSGIGKPYDPADGSGAIGRNYAYQTNSGATAFFDAVNFNPFIANGVVGQGIDEFNGDNFDHSGLGFFGGASIASNPTSGWPIGGRQVPPGTPRWGSEWKKATASAYLSTTVVRAQGSSYSTKDNYLDLDPTYKDRFGRPLLRLTFNFPDNDIKMSAFVTKKAAEIAKAMGARQVQEAPRKNPFSSQPFQSLHNTGGAIMGDNPRETAVNRYLQSWDVSNVFVVGASAIPQNAGYNLTETVASLAYMSADAIVNKYLKSPGAMIDA